MKSAAQIRRETAERMGNAPPPRADDGQGIPDDLRCSTPNCRNRWSVNFARGRRCSPCDDRMRGAEQVERQLFTRPPSLEGASTRPEEDPDVPLPF